jgi:O-antigen biosynthesis protein
VTAFPSILRTCEPRPSWSPTASVEDVPRAACRVRVDGKFFRRGQERLRLHGVTYGPFAPNSGGESLPERPQVLADWQALQAAGFNSVRLYQLPPEWLLQLADELGLLLLLDVPWPKHLCFLDSAQLRHEAERLVQQAGKRGCGHPCVLAYSLGNEIRASIVRWHGRHAVERFLAQLADRLRQVDPQGLVTYANYPPTEYLELPFVDFATFNVYLHDREVFNRYLLRLHNRIGEQPLVLGEVGLDSYRHGEAAQAQLVTTQLHDASLLGAAGVFVFAWTDEWYTGGAAVGDWAFGLTDHHRRPKPAYTAAAELLQVPLVQRLKRTPRVSVVVCSYNGAATLAQCLTSLTQLDYPDYEVIVVDDGSTDDTPELLKHFPSVRVLRQPNQGLSVARNAGLAAATGEIIAYTDADCYADADWLTHLVYHFERSDAAGVGGPNLTPDDGVVATCVAAAPGQPTHVLESDQVAEHIPGCNMAFRREALLAVSGFDPAYKQAGDDVDLCWRLQQAGYWITFAPGAFVWHHRRQTPRAYLRQQAGYGEAEALLRFKHPDKFTWFGHGKWRGSLYGASLRGVSLSGALIYRGTFATGLFQCLYQPVASPWASLPCTLEWHGGLLLLALAGWWWPELAGAAALGWLLSLGLAALQAVQARLPQKACGWRSRLLVMGLCYVQPLVRSWRRYRTRWWSYRAPTEGKLSLDGVAGLSELGRAQESYWSADGGSRLQLLAWVVAYVNEHRWGRALDSGWSDWDLRLYVDRWTLVEVRTAEEEHGGGRQVVRVDYRLRGGGWLRLLGFGALAGLLVGSGLAWWWLVEVCGAVLVGVLGLWQRGRRRGRLVRALMARGARELGMVMLPNTTTDERPSP